MDINEIFEEEGILKQKNNMYKKRPSQVEGANLINKSLKENKHFIFEGPCGFGKSIAYLIPAVKKLIENDFNGKLVIVTSNISLQDQLLDKDIPFVIDVFKSIYDDKKNKISVLLEPKTLKGIPNFLCKDKIENKKILYRNKLRNLYSYYKLTTNGDLSKIHFDLSKEERNIVTTESTECKSSLCSYKKSCFYKNHKKEASKAKIVVTNYSMLFTCLSNDGDELDNMTTIVFDEAHEIQRILREFTCEKISYNTIIDIEKIQLINSLKQLPNAEEFVFELNKLLTYLNNISSLMNSSYNSNEYDENIKNDIESSILQVKRNIKMCIFITYEAEIILKDNNIVMWIENENNSINLCKKNIDVSQLFKALCLNQRQNQPKKICIFTSATLSIGRSFEYFKNQLALNKLPKYDVNEYIGSSPFNLSKQQLW